MPSVPPDGLPDAAFPAAPKRQRTLRLATYNVEWFNGLFDDRGHLLADAAPSARYGVTRAQQLEALGIVFTAMDADGVMIIEAPDTGSKRSSVRALEQFARQFDLRTRRAISGFASETEQEISFLYDPARLEVAHDPQGMPPLHADPKAIPRFDGVYWHDLNIDNHPERISFSKPPLELAVKGGGHELRLIGVHAKSKSPYGARNKAQMIRISIDNRRKQLAQCLWLRERVEAHLYAGDSLMVMGDFNDGPGLDEYEKLFGQSGVEIVLAPDAVPGLQLTDPHAKLALASRIGIQPTTARFYLAPQKRFFEALLDFIMVSPDLAAGGPEWRIWHPMNDPACLRTPELRDALLAASDHFPVTVDLFADPAGGDGHAA